MAAGPVTRVACENFAQFFETWLAEQKRDLQSLHSAASFPPPRTRDEASARDRRLRPLIASVLSSYEHYYTAKAASARRDVLPMFTPTWTSSTENLFLWIGGWRPSMAFQLLYSKCGVQIESGITELVGNLDANDLGDIDTDQLRRIDELHRRTVRLEREKSEEAAAAQEMVADSNMVGISHAITEMRGGDGEEMMEVEMKAKMEAMGKVLEKADGLRMETLKGLVAILRPIQAVHFLIAAAELHLRLHEYGMSKDAAAREAGTVVTAIRSAGL
ncbi:hypothetical protein HPP92_011704 [Vanilla planifolia]|uniref:DOG1 domain-containing protein n=1 Tax=Vanilla planifolia TaxID=51239 RepID=A0A835R1A6_VANPL|nr:hypothetical protein HPP92_011704 [Vanilla planifolia]